MPAIISPAILVDPPSLEILLGPQLIGNMISNCLFGIFILQTFYGLLLLETLHTFATGHALWYYVCKANSVLEKELGVIRWPEASIPLLGGIAILCVQIFYSWRIYMLRGGMRVFTIISVLVIPPIAITAFVANVYMSARMLTFSLEPELLTLATPIEVSTIVTAVCDIFIAVSMVYVLAASRRRVRAAGSPSTETVLTRLIAMTIETGTVTALGAAITSFVLFMAFRKSGFFIATTFAFPRLYPNSLMVSLNSSFYARINDSRSLQNNVEKASPRGPSHSIQHPVIIITKAFNVSHEGSDNPSSDDNLRKGDSGNYGRIDNVLESP
ncbi:hypothetical protein OF83DRAFT_1177158 [Amylostereum chailletii]|nr:hypothetical protein OF83DRAFT_1177158 [Amylostereum chailletii]